MGNVMQRSVLQAVTTLMHCHGTVLLTQCPDSAVATPGDLDAAYADALLTGGVHLMRLCGKTGPVWGQLSTRTCQALLEVFIKHVRVRMVHQYARKLHVCNVVLCIRQQHLGSHAQCGRPPQRGRGCLWPAKG